MEIDAVDEYGVVGMSFSIPGFLKKVFTEELGGYDDGISDLKLLAIALHAVFLESGFVGFDTKSRTEIKRLQFRNNWPMNSSEFSLFYTVPEIINRVSPSPCSRYQDAVVELKFHIQELILNVYGSLALSPAKHSISLEQSELTPFLKITWADCSFEDEIRVLATREILKFWRDVKDKFALPLLTDLCNKSGLQPPPCLLDLPEELQLKILELLPGIDVARMRCVSKDLRMLASTVRLQIRVQRFKDQKFDRPFRHYRSRQAKFNPHRARERVGPVGHLFPCIECIKDRPCNPRIYGRPRTEYILRPNYGTRHRKRCSLVLL